VPRTNIEQGIDGSARPHDAPGRSDARRADQRIAGGLEAPLNKLTIIALSTLLCAPIAVAKEAPTPIDYGARFAAKFPALAGEHQVLDWGLYSALIGGDIVQYAVQIDATAAARLEELRGKEFQIEQWQAGLRRDARLRAAFDEQRRRLSAMVLFVEGDGVVKETCSRPLVYLDKEFRLILGETNRGGDPLELATVAPSCRQAMEPGFQITAGRSSRFRCWRSAEYARTCAWRLPDMPEALKHVIESDYPGSIKLRWRWRGVGDVVHVRNTDANGNRVGERDSIAVTIPAELGLEFVDGSGKLLWTANAVQPDRPRVRHAEQVGCIGPTANRSRPSRQ
jgi:hypothetical protein